jgi:hypothetical protein
MSAIDMVLKQNGRMPVAQLNIDRDPFCSLNDIWDNFAGQSRYDTGHRSRKIPDDEFALRVLSAAVKAGKDVTWEDVERVYDDIKPYRLSSDDREIVICDWYRSRDG